MQGKNYTLLPCAPRRFKKCKRTSRGISFFNLESQALAGRAGVGKKV